MDVAQWIDDNSRRFVGVSGRLWRYAEIGYQEKRSAELLAKTLEEAGFLVQQGVAEIPTAFVASYGAGQPTIAILGEYDALPGLSQDRVPYRKPLREGAAGHGCAHNLLGAGSLAAAIAVAEAIDSGDCHGTVRYYGCPAEEGGYAKTFMVRAGLFQDVDLTLSWHPGMFNGSTSANVLACIKVYFRFYGKAAHAGADPFNGRSALDAVELMNVGVNYLREHVIPDARMHYIISRGGEAPNIVPDFAESCYFVRAPLMGQLHEIYERVKNVGRGAALMTDTEMQVAFVSAASNLVPNDTIVSVLHAKMQELGALEFTDEENRFAAELVKTFPSDSLRGYARVLGREIVEMMTAEKQKGNLLFGRVLPIVKTEALQTGSTDVGDVSWVAPTGEIATTCRALGTPGHSWQVAAQAGMSIGHKGMLYAGKALALGAIEFMRRPELVRQARQEFAERTRETPYLSPIPDGTRPPLDD